MLPTELGNIPAGPVHSAMFLSRFSVKKSYQSVSRRGPLPRTTVQRQNLPDPLYLFFCAQKWHNTGDTTSGWELVQAMHSPNRGVRALAAELFAETVNGRLLVRDLRRTPGGLHEIQHYRPEAPQTPPAERAETMNTPYGLQIVENCASCKLRKQGWYCALSSDLLKAFQRLFPSHNLPRRCHSVC